MKPLGLMLDQWKTKHHAYFLEGKRELIDVEGEWWYNDSAQTTPLQKTPANQNANNLDLRTKTQPYAFSVINSDDVAFENLEFLQPRSSLTTVSGVPLRTQSCDIPAHLSEG